MNINKNTVMILISIFFVSVLSITSLFVLFIGLLTPKMDLTNHDVVYSTEAQNNIIDSETTDSVEEPEDSNEALNFKADLSKYEEYMNPDGDEYLTLINRDNMLSKDYVPEDLVDVKATRKDGRNTQKMRLYAAMALEAMLLEADANGMNYVNESTGQSLSVTSAYRSYEYQAQRLAEETANYGSEELALQVVQYPGASEHQSGLCCDMHNMSSAVTAFEDQDAAKWLAENCHKFGFILRYPKDKTGITGISFEPWHFRYVGRYHATKMYELDMCLEEYWAYLGK